jgi:LysR family transcriptional activator of nhaA
MAPLNYHHLRYFWAVAREGGVTRASEKLHVSQPSVSAQLRELEDALGEKLILRGRRTQVLTEVGRLVYRYSDEIFGLGQELEDALRGRPTRRPARLSVGVADVLPKLVVQRLIEPALRLPQPILLECLEDRAERLLAELAVHALDVVLSDAPVGPGAKVRAYSHLLGESDVSIFATPRLAAAYRRGYPGSLEGAPFLLPTEDAALRLSLERWFDTIGVRIRLVGEFQDSALLTAFGRTGAGLVAAPTVVESVMRRHVGLRLVGRVPSIRERYYAITVDRKLRHPAAVAISEAARSEIFG